MKVQVFLRLRYLLLLGFALALVGCSPSQSVSPTATTAPLQPVTVQLSWTHQAEFAGIYEAIAQGYYAREGLDVSLLEGGQQGDTFVNAIEVVSSGQAQFGLTSGLRLLTAREAGEPVVAVSGQFQRSPRVYIALASSNISNVQDFVGKKVVDRPDLHSLFLALLETAGITEDQFTPITDPNLFSIDALINGDVDVTTGFVTSEVTQLVARGHEVNIITLGDYGIEDFSNAIFTTDEIITSNPDMVTRFLRATIDGLNYALDNSGEAAELTLQYDSAANLEELNQKLDRLLPLIRPAGTRVGDFNEQLWNNLISVGVKYGVLQSEAGVAGAYSRQFLDQLYQAQQ